jgi:hypothetical protein
MIQLTNDFKNYRTRSKVQPNKTKKICYQDRQFFKQKMNFFIKKKTIIKDNE